MRSRHLLPLLFTLAAGCASHRPETRHAKSASNVPELCTEEQKAARFSGKAIVSCTITKKGTVEDCEVKQPLPPMTEAIVDALLASTYDPILYKGKPVAVRYTFTLDVNCK